jgi:thioredoxin 1
MDADHSPELPSARPKLNILKWLWLAVIGGLLYLQWPVLKEMYYNLAGVELPESTIQWHDNLDSAMSVAQAENRPILTVFGAGWCPPCRQMKREVWPDATVSALVESKFVPLYVDIDDKTQAEIVAGYQIRGIPAVLVLDAQGQVEQRRNTMSRSETLKFLKDASHDSGAPALDSQ